MLTVSMFVELGEGVVSKTLVRVDARLSIVKKRSMCSCDRKMEVC